SNSRKSCSRRGRSNRKLQPPKPDKGEYINFNEILDVSWCYLAISLQDEEFDDDKDSKKKTGKEGKNEERLKEETARDEAGREEKEEKREEKEREEGKGEKEETQPSLSAVPKQEKPKSCRKSARSTEGKSEKAAHAAPKEPPGRKILEARNAVNDMKTGAVRPRRHEDTLYQVPIRMPEVDFTKLH
ncbi:hypothetical protein PMAYCL1PPCAC_19775, partial [Pristionchus mayeri]